MRYDDPKLRAILAGEYVMGTLPPRARARFERLMAADPALAAAVEEWRERFSAIDLAAKPATPTPRVWEAIEAATRVSHREARIRVPLGERIAEWWDSAMLWRGLAFGALAVILVAIIAPRLLPPSSPLVVAVLNDPSGAPAFLVTRQRNFEIAAIRPQPVAAGRALELWAIAGGPPRSLGLVLATGDHRILPEAALPHDGVLAVSLEPAGGSPTGQPTGPVLYQGKILAASF